MLQKYASAYANQHNASYEFGPLTEVVSCVAADASAGISDDNCHGTDYRGRHPDRNAQQPKRQAHGQGINTGVGPA